MGKWEAEVGEWAPSVGEWVSSARVEAWFEAAVRTGVGAWGRQLSGLLTAREGEVGGAREAVEVGDLIRRWIARAGWAAPLGRCASEGSLGWQFTRGELFEQTERSSPSERRVSLRASTTSSGERRSSGFPPEAVGDGGGADSTGTGFPSAAVRDGEGVDSTLFLKFK